MSTLSPAERLDLMKDTRVNRPDGIVATTGDGRVNILFDRFLGHPPARVWRALTSPAETIGWIGKLVTFEPHVGGAIRYEGLGPEHQGEQLIVDGVITRYEPERVLEFEGGAGVLGFELTSRDSGCQLRFWNTLPAGARQSNSITAGWHQILENLHAAICGAPVDLRAQTRDRVIEVYFLYRGEKRC